MKISHILVPVDFSDCSLEAIKVACELSRLFRATIDLLHVVEPILPSSDLMVTQPYDYPIEALENRLTRLPLPLEKARKSRRTVRIGYAADTIVAYANEIAADLIVIGTNGRKGLAHLLLGSVAERVVRLAPCTTVVVRAKSAKSAIEAPSQASAVPALRPTDPISDAAAVPSAST